MLPLAVGMDEAGREIEGPMAVAILGGLITSMEPNLLVLPILALRYKGSLWFTLNRQKLHQV